MQTIHIQVSDKVYDRFMWFLKKFGKNEIKILEEENTFLKAQKQAEKNLNELKNTQIFDSLEDLERKLEDKIKKYED